MVRRRLRPKSVLFVCLGNICRSPAAEGVMRHLVSERGLDDLIRVDSAGTGAYHTGEPADPRMSRAAEKRGYELTSRARQIALEDYRGFDLIVAMDRENLRNLVDLAPDRARHVRLLSSFLSPDSPSDVPDPYYGGAKGFETVLDMLEEACPTILEYLTMDWDRR